MMSYDTSVSKDTNGLALAMVASSNAPLLLLGGDLTVIAASASFCREFDVESPNEGGRKLSELGHGEWALPQLGTLLRATAGGSAEIDAYEIDLTRDGRQSRRLVLNARKLDYGDSANIRLILAVADVTDARLGERVKDDLLREKAILLQELQHRVANSLQIVASVLLLSARRVQSEETRTHLNDAHHRVMSIAAVQRQLAVSSLENVGLRAYLIELCASLGASMIRDHGQLTLEVTVDDSAASPNASVSLGLIVTELVINALKHAFPDGRHGKILVDYRAIGSGWSLSVADDGIGMSVGDVPKPGLGTSIVEALANQLGAVVDVRSTDPGTRVSIIYR